MPIPASFERTLMPRPARCRGPAAAVRTHSAADERVNSASDQTGDATVGRVHAAADYCEQHAKEMVAAVKRVSGSEELQRSVEDIEGAVWPIPTPEETYLVRTVHRLRRVPIGELSIEDLRIMLSQNVGTSAILPLALDQLEANPLAAGHHYPGDLLRAVLRLPRDQWSVSASLLDKARSIVQRADAMTAELDGAQGPELRRLVSEFLSD